MTHQQEDYRQQQELRRIENRKNDLLALAAYGKERGYREAIRLCSEHIQNVTDNYVKSIEAINRNFDFSLKEAQNNIEIDSASMVPP